MIDGMNGAIENRLRFIIAMVETIKSDFNINGEVHYDYYLEKLKRAKDELDSLVSIGEMYKEKDQSKKEDDSIE